MNLVIAHLSSSALHPPSPPSPCPLTLTAINYLPQGEGGDDTAALGSENQCQPLCLDIFIMFLENCAKSDKLKQHLENTAGRKNGWMDGWIEMSIYVSVLL